MRRCLSILLTIVILLTLGMELCSSPGVAWGKDTSHWGCVLADDDADSEVKHSVQRDDSVLHLDGLSVTGPHLMNRLAQTGLVLSFQGSEVVTLTSGVRWHRWLCREQC